MELNRLCNVISILLVTVSGHASSEVKQLAIIKAHSSSVRAVCFSPDGSLLATGSYDGNIKLWETGTWHLRRSIRASDHGVSSLTFVNGGTRLASASVFEPIAIWDVATGRLVHSIAAPADHGAASSVAFTPIGSMLAAGYNTGQVCVFSAQTWKLVRNLYKPAVGESTPSFSPVWQLVFSRDGRLLAAASGGNQDQIWFTRDWSPLHSINMPRCTSVSISPNSKLFAAASDELPVKIWNTSSPGAQPTTLANTEESYVVAFSPGGRIMAVAGNEWFKLFDVVTWHIDKALAYLGWVRALCYSPDGKVMAAGDDNGTIALWRMQSPAGSRKAKH